MSPKIVEYRDGKRFVMSGVSVSLVGEEPVKEADVPMDKFDEVRKKPHKKDWFKEFGEKRKLDKGKK